MGEIGTDENFGDKTGGDRPREHCILKWDAVGSILKQTKRKHQLTIKTCIKYVDTKSPVVA